jgi:quercetin dioxygenase-like cupin family protein
MTIKKVSKPWGHELWMTDETKSPYTLKRILFKAGNRTSLQVHQEKYETNYVLSGKGKLYRSKEKLDIDRYLKDGFTEEELLEYIINLEEIVVHAGDVYDMAPGIVHRVEAITDMEFIECSTNHLDDVIRLHDDQGRTHGRIESEHQ